MFGRRELEEQTSELMQGPFLASRHERRLRMHADSWAADSSSAARGCALLQGEIPALSELPSPWGPKAYEPTEGDKLMGPAKFPTAFNPRSDTPMVA